MADIATAFASWSATSSSNQPDNSDSIGPNTLADNLRVIQAVVRSAVGGDDTIASASTTDLSTIEANYIAVTGTTTITALGTLSAGVIKILKFAGILTFTHNGTSLILPAAANITTAAGDVAIMRSEGSGNWRCLVYMPAAGYISASAVGTSVQAYDADLTTIAGLTATTDNFIQSKSSAWASRTPTQVTADLIAMVGDSGSGGTKGLVPAPAAGDAAANKFLKADGTWSSGTGITLATPQASTSGTAIDFSSIPAGTKRVTVGLTGVSTNGTSNLLVQIGPSGGVETTGYLAMATGSGGAGATASTTGFSLSTTNYAAGTFNGALTLTLVNSSTNAWVATACTNQTGGPNAAFCSGSKPLAGALSKLRLTTVNGTDTFDAGEINITYE